MNFQLLSIFTLISCATSSPFERSEIAQPRADDVYYRLPTSVIPNEYSLILAPNFTDFTFEGFVEISITVVQETQNITLHASDITFLQTVVLNETENVPIVNETEDSLRDFYILWFNDSLSTGNYQIQINYTGKLQSSYKGFYRSSYTNSANEVR